jgi:3-isopropylmalate/(R)-2-methylmalate dehydratase small subunit
MEKFVKLNGIAAPLRMINVDTDIIIPKQFLKTIKRAGLGKSAFYDIRYNDDGSEKADFVLNRAPYRGANILITGENFGCGSSREHAPWAILDMGIRCVIAESFADIFYNNSFKNGILPIKLPKDQVETLMKEVEENPGSPFEIDLEKQLVTRGNKFSFSFDIDPFRKHCLLNGLDDIGLTEVKSAKIKDFENNDHNKRPWI